MSTLEIIKSKIEEITKQKEELVASLRKDFAPMFIPLFEKSNGKIKSFGWSQYTPYFNDGDECIFGVNTDLDYGLLINGEQIDVQDGLFGSSLYALNIYGTDDYENWILKYPEDKINEETKNDDLHLFSVITEIKDTLRSIDDEFYKDLFGDHVEVTINSDGSVSTENYSHD